MGCRDGEHCEGCRGSGGRGKLSGLIANVGIFSPFSCFLCNLLNKQEKWVTLRKFKIGWMVQTKPEKMRHEHYSGSLA